MGAGGTLLSPVRRPPSSLGTHFIPSFPLLPLHFELEKGGPQRPWWGTPGKENTGAGPGWAGLWTRLPDRPTSQKPSPAWSRSPLGCTLNPCPSPEGGGRGWGSPTSWATRLEMRTARLTRPFWTLGCRALVLLAFPAGAAMEDVAAPSLPALGPQGPPAPHLHPSGSPSPGCAPETAGWLPGQPLA